MRVYYSPPSMATAANMHGDKGYVEIKFHCGGCSQKWVNARTVMPNDWLGEAWAHEVIVPELIREMRERGYFPGEPLACPDCRGES